MSNIIRKCKQTLQTYYQDKFDGLVLFGSSARAMDAADSDLDLIVLLKQPFDYFEELRAITDLLYPLQLETDRLISARPADSDEYEAGNIQLYRNAKREGLVI